MVKKRWEAKKDKYSNGSRLFIGKIFVASVDWTSGSRNAEVRKPWKVTYLLPGIANPTEQYLNEADAKARAERGVAKWFEWVNE